MADPIVMPEGFDPQPQEGVVQAGLTMAQANPGRWILLGERMVPAVTTHIQMGNHGGARGEYEAVVGDGGGNRAEIYVRWIEDPADRGPGRGR